MTQQTTFTWPQPAASRPHVPGYGIPEDEQDLLPWSRVVERLQEARNYWVDTAGADCRPHATPIWGGFVDGALYFEGGPHTRRGRNLAANPHVAVHLESGNDVVIVEGTAEEIKGPGPALAQQLVEDLTRKYGDMNYQPTADQWDEGGLYVVHPAVVFAWSAFPRDATRFTF